MIRQGLGGEGVVHAVYGVIVSVYAPTHRASQVDKGKFYADLQSVVDGVSAEDVLLVVGDFNARVGSGDEWDGVCGRHGVGLMNTSGEALLAWCSLNGLVVMNTVFEGWNQVNFQTTWEECEAQVPTAS